MNWKGGFFCLMGILVFLIAIGLTQGVTADKGKMQPLLVRIMGPIDDSGNILIKDPTIVHSKIITVKNSTRNIIGDTWESDIIEVDKYSRYNTFIMINRTAGSHRMWIYGASVNTSEDEFVQLESSALTNGRIAVSDWVRAPYYKIVVNRTAGSDPWGATIRMYMVK